jgi:parallel beta-helix repeat protein
MTSRPCHLTALAALLLAATPAAWPASYYVAAQDPAAADANPGTEARPFLTISAAMSRVQPGDTVWVKDGVYREQVTWPGPDWKDPEVRCTLAAFPGQRPIISGSDVLTETWERLPGDRPIFSCPRETYTQMLFADLQRLEQIGWQGHPDRVPEKRGGFVWQRKWIGKGLADMKPGSFFYDDPGKRLYVWLRDGGDPALHTLEAAVRPVGIGVVGTWTVSGLEVRHIMDGLWPTEQAVALTGDRCIIEGCRILQNEFLGLIVSGADCAIRGNEIADNGLEGFTSNVGYRMLFEGNELHHNAWRGDVECLTAGNKMVVWRDCKFMRNWWHDEPASALWLDISDGNVLIAENRFDNCSVGIYFEISRWAVIANNVFRGCGRGVWSYSSDVLVAHNVFDRCGEGVTISGYVRTCDETQSTREPIIESLMAVRNNLVVNNIVTDSAGFFVGITPDDGYGAGNYSDYNAFVWTLPASHATGNHINFGYGWNAIYARLPEWSIIRHYDTHSVISDPYMRGQMEIDPRWAALSLDSVLREPGFMDRAVGDYRLRPDSPLRGRGLTLPMTLNSACQPCVGNEVRSRQWARTRLADAPAGVPVTSVYGGDVGFYRLQPLPLFHRLVDLDACPPGDPGLNPVWQATGVYPTFDASRPADIAADTDWMVFPQNRLADPSFDKPLGRIGTPGPGPWFSGGEVHLFAGIGCANLLPGNLTDVIAYQKVGTVAPECSYVLFGDMLTSSLTDQLGAVTSIYLAAGDDRQPLGPRAELLAEPGQTRTWYTVGTEVRTGKAGEDPAVGRDLYVVLASRCTGPAGVAVDGAAAFARWDNLTLLTGQPPQ